MTRDAENWDRLQTLFHLCEHTPTEELDAQLLAAEPDAELRRRARTLILAGRTDTPALPQAALPGHIGPYRVLRHLGTGGMGAVYLVERLMGGVIQHTALKVLSRNAVGPFFLERFAREQYILASLDHPNITRMLDAGLSDASEPYLVMEYVDGLHLDVYCDRHSLDIPARLKLFVSVCDAIAYAHRNLVVHLDLKPSNILASEGDGRVKVLDFGTSKLITADGSLTTTLMVTPAYASPEQLRNEAVTTSCDIYALGAILYELLAGQRPNFERSISNMIERSISEQAPEPVTEAVTDQAAERRGLTVTRLRSLLSGDLVTIVAKCLRPRPQDRYPNVDALIVDIQLYLAGRPVLARPQTTTYRVGKFVRRNRTTVASVSALICCLLVVGGYAVWRQNQAYREGQRALHMQTLMENLFRLANSKYTGKPAATVPELLRLGITMVPAFIQDPRDQQVAQLSLAQSMYLNGDLKDALPVYKAVIVASKANGDINSEVESEAYAGDILEDLGDIGASRALTAHALNLAGRSRVTPIVRVWAKVFFASNREDGGARSDENIALLQSAADESGRKLPERQTALILGKLAGYLEQRGRLADAAPVLERAIAIFDKEPYAACDKAESYGDLAYVKGAEGDSKGSVEMFERAYFGLKTCSGPETRPTLMMQAHLASALLKNKQAGAVVTMLEASMPAWRLLAGDGPDLANPLIFLARAYLANGDFVKSESAAAEAVRIQRGKIPEKSYRMGVSQLVWAQALTAQDHRIEALPHCRLAVVGLASSPALTSGQRQVNAEAQALLKTLQPDTTP